MNEKPSTVHCLAISLSLFVLLVVLPAAFVLVLYIACHSLPPF